MKPIPTTAIQIRKRAAELKQLQIAKEQRAIENETQKADALKHRYAEQLIKEQLPQLQQYKTHFNLNDEEYTDSYNQVVTQAHAQAAIKFLDQYKALTARQDIIDKKLKRKQYAIDHKIKKQTAKAQDRQTAIDELHQTLNQLRSNWISKGKFTHNGTSYTRGKNNYKAERALIAIVHQIQEIEKSKAEMNL